MKTLIARATPQSRTPAAPRRRAIAYMATIVIPTLVLLALGLQSVRRQRDALEALTAHNERLSTERIAGAFESRIRDLAERAIRDDEFGRVLPLLLEPASPANQRVIREAVAPIVNRHPVASRLVLLSGASARFPVSTWPSLDTIDDLLEKTNAGLASRFASWFRDAERKEIDERDAEGAALFYRRCVDLPVSARLKAIALARAARCYRQAGHLRAAADVWQKVTERHADDDDLFHRPYGLVGALQLIELAETTGERSRYVRTAILQRDLARGRWEISAEQAEYFVHRVRPAAPHGPFLTQMQLAGVAERTIAGPETLRPGELHQTIVRLGDRDCPFLYGRLGASVPASAATAGFVVDEEWAGTLLSEIAEQSGVSTAPPVLVTAARDLAKDGAQGSELRLQDALSVWALAPVVQRPAISARRAEMLLFGSATTLLLGMLVLGVALMLRDVARDRELTHLRADFVSGVSHQLRTPLTLIRLYSEMLTDYPDTSERERRERLDVITSESQRLAALIDRVLDFSRIEHGQRPYVLERGDLAATVRHVVDAYAEYLRRRGFDVEVRIDDELPPVRFDASAVADGVVNLIDNAAKYAADGRYVLARLVAHGADAVALEIVDRGPGIPEHERERLFQPFVRGSGRQEKGGCGLGLFLVRALMEAHGGRAEVESVTGQGSLFRLVFPVDRD